MKMKDFIMMCLNYHLDMDVEIECPNGLLVEPSIKIKHEYPMNPFSPVVGYVVSWDN